MCPLFPKYSSKEYHEMKEKKKKPKKSRLHNKFAHRISKIPYIEIQCEINGTLEIATSKFSKSFKIPKFLDAKMLTARSNESPKTRPPN